MKKRLHWAVQAIHIIAALVAGSYYLIGIAVGSSYHPIATKGSYFYKLWFIPLVLVLINIIVTFVLVQKSKKDKNYIAFFGFMFSGIVAVIWVFLTPVLSRIDTGYAENCYIGEQQYEVHWRYYPKSCSGVAGDTGFSIQVFYPNFEPRYVVENRSNYNEILRLSKSVVQSEKLRGHELVEVCETKTVCQILVESPHGFDHGYGEGYFIEDGFVYAYGLDVGEASFETLDEVQLFKRQVVDLFDSFKKEGN